MTYSIFTSTGNLVDAFDDRDAALALLGQIVKSEPEAADEVFLVAQDDEGNFVGETVYRFARLRKAAGSVDTKRDGSLLEACDVA